MLRVRMIVHGCEKGDGRRGSDPGNKMEELQKVKV